MSTLAAFWIFKQECPDIIILEVGIGGRLEATNLLDADLSIITTIDLDHQAWLGDTREVIGYEKAGILRQNKPAIYADDNPPNSIVSYAIAHGVPMRYLNQDYGIEHDASTFTLSFKTGRQYNFPMPLVHLKAAAAAIVASIELQETLPVLFEHWTSAMQRVMIEARQQWIDDGLVQRVFDVAHNPQAVQLLAKSLREKKSCQRIHAVFSGLKDKDLPGLVEPMREIVDFWYPTLLPGSRAADEALLQDAFRIAQIEWPRCFSDPVLAYHAAMHDARPGDWVVVYGSFLTVGAIFALQQTAFAL
jgi:dihydrofolate synthase/folylpolyglutamate synthase